jgi:hypothetical protein
VIWIMAPLLAFVLFGLYVRREAERLRAEDVRPKLLVRLKLAGTGMATREELRMRQAIEDEIEKRGIGSISDTGSGDGWAHLQVAVTDPAAAAQQIRDLLAERGVTDGSVAEVPTAVP